MWPGCDFHFKNTSISYNISYNVSVKYEDRIDTLLNWFNNSEKPINLGMMYFEQPDLDCHSYGPDSNEVNKQLQRVDNALKYFLRRSNEMDLLPDLNIILVSDHGGQTVKTPQNLIKLENFVNKSWYTSAGATPNLQIYPIKGMSQQ